MHRAVKNNDCNLVDAMFQCRAFDPNELDYNFKPPISYIKSVEMLNIFLEYDDGLDNAAFHIISNFDTSTAVGGETLVIILEHLLDGKYDYDFGANPIDAAVFIDRDDLKIRVIRLLVKHGAKIEPHMVFTDALPYVAPFVSTNKEASCLDQDSQYISRRIEKEYFDNRFRTLMLLHRLFLNHIEFTVLSSNGWKILFDYEHTCRKFMLGESQ